MVEHRRVFVDGIAATRADVEVQETGKVTVGRKAAPSAEHGLAIIYEDAQLIIVDKPAGLLSVAARDDGRTSVWAAVRRHVAPSGTDAYLVHRLDEAASGLLVFAKDVVTQEALKKLFAAHDIDRLYVAVVDGVLREASGTVDQPLVESDVPPYKVRVLTPHAPPGIMARAESAVTHWRRLAVDRGRTAVMVRLETGRKHQIRVHLSFIGHPIAGDDRYNGRSAPRLLLHALVLGFVHPVTGRRVVATSRPDVTFRRAFSALPDPLPTTW